MVGLIGGFGLGQGSLFLVQTWLITIGEVEFLGRFGLAFTMIILAYQVVDLGGVVILARHTLLEKEEGSPLAQFYWSFSAVRVALAIALSLAVVVWSLVRPPSFEATFAITSLPGLMIYAFNQGGILDGHKWSGWAGAAWAIPFVTSALALPFAAHLPAMSAGHFLGISLSLGATLAVAVQAIALRFIGITLAPHRPNWSIMHSSAKEGALYLMGWLPGQIYFRGQVALSAALLGPAQTALFIYAKQLIMSGTRFLYFARRVEFPTLVKQLADHQHITKKTLRLQKYSIAASVIGTAALVFIGIGLHMLFPSSLKGAGLVIAIFAPIVFTSSINATLIQACFAVRDFKLAAWSSNLTTIAGLCLQYALVLLWGLSGIAAAEAIMQIISAILISARLENKFSKKTTSIS